MVEVTSGLTSARSRCKNRQGIRGATRRNGEPTRVRKTEPHRRLPLRHSPATELPNSCPGDGSRGA